jgi:DNA-binding SARP family transcriptional activator
VTRPIVRARPGSYVARTLQTRARIWLCGPLRVELDGRRVEALLPARQGRLLFAYLVLRRRRPVGRDELVEALWPREAPVDPHAALNTLVARLRAALGVSTIGGRGELSLALGLDPWIDVETA